MDDVSHCVSWLVSCIVSYVCMLILRQPICSSPFPDATVCLLRSHILFNSLRSHRPKFDLSTNKSLLCTDKTQNYKAYVAEKLNKFERFTLTI